MIPDTGERAINPPGAFLQALRAEEEPWLETVYVPPAEMDALSGEQSMILFGKPGSGRTALRLAITRRVQGNLQQKALVVNWLPEAPADALDGNQLARFAMRQFISVWLEALLLDLINDPEPAGRAPVYLRRGLSFLLHEYLDSDPQFYLLARANELPEAGLTEMQALLSLEPIQLLRPEATTQTIINAIAAVLKQLGYQKTWIFVDGLEKWQSGLKLQNRDMQAAMLDTLNYFDRKDMTFKVFVLEEFSSLYASIGGVDRFRLLPQVIHWSDEDLLRITDLHSARLFQLDTFSLKQITQDPGFLEWLSKHSGGNPRWWMLLSRPFVQHYISINKDQVQNKQLDEAGWRDIAARYPPPLRILHASQQVLLGAREAKVSPSGFSILSYLFQNSQRTCSREEVYYLAVCGLEQIPSMSEDRWETPESWTSRLDTILWRLRRDIEMDLNQPTYIITERGKGICLRNAWL